MANNITGNAVGITGFTGTIQFSRINGNGIGIIATAGQIVQYDIITNNTTYGLHISGVANVRVFEDTFYQRDWRQYPDR